MRDSKTYYSGISFLELLGVAFIVLKLMHYIDWSWWLVTLPLYAPFLIVLAVFVVVFVITIVTGIVALIIEKFDN
jgi:membrane-bound ClpP family serine protease